MADQFLLSTPPISSSPPEQKPSKTREGSPGTGSPILTIRPSYPDVIHQRALELELLFTQMTDQFEASELYRRLAEDVRKRILPRNEIKIRSAIFLSWESCSIAMCTDEEWLLNDYKIRSMKYFVVFMSLIALLRGTYLTLSLSMLGDTVAYSNSFFSYRLLPLFDALFKSDGLSPILATIEEALSSRSQLRGGMRFRESLADALAERYIIPVDRVYVQGSRFTETDLHLMGRFPVLTIAREHEDSMDDMSGLITDTTFLFMPTIETKECLDSKVDYDNRIAFKKGGIERAGFYERPKAGFVMKIALGTQTVWGSTYHVACDGE